MSESSSTAPLSPATAADEMALIGVGELPTPMGPLPYHRLAHLAEGTSQWWRPLATTGVALGLYVGVLIPVVVLAVVWALLLPVAPGLPTPSETLSDPLNPLDWLFTLGLLALMIPAVVFGVRWGGGRRGTVHSVVGRIRWKLMGRSAAFIFPIYAVYIFISYALDPPDDFAVPEFTPALVTSYLLIVLLTPLQCASEEYAFRALPQQAFGTWLKSPLWGILLPVPLFMAGHGYDWVGQVSIAAFALSAGFLVWKSGGLELAVVIHTANNLFIFLLAPFSRSSLEQGAVDPSALFIDLPFTVGVTALATCWISRREGVGFFEPVRGTGNRGKEVTPLTPRGHHPRLT